MTDFAFAEGFVVNILIVANRPENFAAFETIADGIILDDALPEAA